MIVGDEGRVRAREALRAREQALGALPLRAPREVLLVVVAALNEAIGAATDSTVGIDLERVIEVVPLAATVAVPDAPADHLGLLRLGRDVIPVVDLVARFAAGGRTGAGVRRLPDLGELIVIVRADDRPLGLVVGSVRGVATTGCPVAEAPAGPWSEWLIGVFPVDGHPVLWLEPSTLAIGIQRDSV